MAVSETSVSPSPVTVHGVIIVGQISPLKTSKTKSGVRYFDGSLSDGRKTLRMISFDPKLREQFEVFMELLHLLDDIMIINCTYCNLYRIIRSWTWITRMMVSFSSLVLYTLSLFRR